MLKKLFSRLFGGNEDTTTSPNTRTSGTVIDEGKVSGKIKFLNKRKGYGFIKSKETSQDVFVHFDDADDFLKRGDLVQFEVEKSDKGLRARNVEVLKR